MSKKICSWDVGIKHLAFCIIKKEDKGFKIEKWENIDLTDNNKLKCCGTLKNKKKSDNIIKNCESDARFFCEIEEKEKKYYCGTHKSQYIVNIKEIEKEKVINLEVSKEKCSHISLKGNKKCIKKAEYKMEENILCKIHKEQKLKEIIKKISLKPIKKMNCSSADPQKICEKMYEKLSKIEEFKDIDEVYIENQPSLINPIMKAVSSMLFSYFVYKFLGNNMDDKIVKYVSPSLKIEITKELILLIREKIKEHKNIKSEKCNCRLCKLETELDTNHTNFEEKYEKYKFTYDPLKELGVIYTEKILKDNNIFESFNLINDGKKKDDRCDAFLHGFKKLKN